VFKLSPSFKLKMYNNIFAATHNFYSKFKNEESRFSAIIIVVVCQMTLTMLLLIVLKKLSVVDVLGLLPNKYYWIPFYAAWLVLVYLFYSKTKMQLVLSSFNKKSLKQKRLWNFISITHLILPIILIAILLTK
jgi:hypothetical protein